MTDLFQPITIGDRRSCLLVADVDGTITQDGRPVPPQLVQKVAEFRRQGGLFTLATGRCLESAAPFLQQLGVDVPAILLNGAQIFDPGTSSALEESFLPVSMLTDFLTWLEANDFDVLIYQGENILVHRLTSAVTRHLIKDGTDHTKINHWLEVHPAQTYKVLLISTSSPEPLLAVQRPDLAAKIRWVNTEPTYWEIMPPGVSKGAALIKLAGLLKLPLTAVAATGDHLNDLELITNAGLGVAVANAHPDLKAAAQKVTANDCWQGVIELLEELLHLLS